MGLDHKTAGSLADHRWRARARLTNNTSVSDPFAVNPIRRSTLLVVGCLLVLVVPWMINEQVGTTVTLAAGWLALTGLVLGLPIMIWCSGEWVVDRVQRRVRPGIELLALTPRIEHILGRHGFITIRDLESMSNDDLLLLSNMDQRGVKEIRQALNVWKYRRWQESGFTTVENE